MSDHLLAEFEKLWISAQTPPDVVVFLKSLDNPSPELIATIIKLDQQFRWRTPSPVTVEHYLNSVPELHDHPPLLLELAAGEFLARVQNEHVPQIDEYLQRFPQLQEQLQERLSGISTAHGSSGTSPQTARSSMQDSASRLGFLEIDEICERFEDAWNDDTAPPSIETIVQAADSQLRPALLKELLRIEICLRHERGEEPTREEYEARFPQDDPVYQQILAEWQQHPHEFMLYERVDADALGATILKLSAMSSQSVSRMLDGTQKIDHFRLLEEMGHGAFGRVFRAHDEQLDRAVAIKVPRKSRFARIEDAETYLAEARVVARLVHPHIVSVYQMGRTTDGYVYIVSQLIEGTNLEHHLKQGRFDLQRIATLIALVARALHYAHTKRLIHRDIKPANILIEEKTGKPYVADFGLAMREEDSIRQVGLAGSPAYMSPEQARQEWHRLDGRSDVFSLGVVLYEMLTGKRPFQGSSREETLLFVVSVDPRSPRSIDETIPAELERICLKAISKRTSDRYDTAELMAEDLEAWLKPVSSPVIERKTDVQVVPKGLRSFDANDASFFLDLLPGTRNRDGLPESIAFWKRRIEETDPEKTFNVGLIYGPSGCGKSSLVKAGLLPHLSKDVIAVYLEATPDETEVRVLRALQKRLVGWTFLSDAFDLSEASATGGNATGASATGRNAHPTGLTETLLRLRRRSQQKIVIIIDQFEQWLHAHRSEPDAELVQALRQCDGVHVQAIVMIRDDFAMAAARFMQALDVAILQGHNFATVDLFEVDHAKNVLIKFGQSFGKLPADSNSISAEEQQFVNNVAAGLAQDGKVVSVRLSLFAEMIKAKRWTPETLQAVGGTEGVGVNFLEETFSSPQANPRHRLHAAAARAVLKSLLPELGTDIKGHMRTVDELREACGYTSRPQEFNDLLRILDGELRLITPTEGGDGGSGEWGVGNGESPQKTDPAANSPFPTPRYYQLTHDYLVPSLRDWLTRKQKETRKGRAELKLEERTALWTAKPEYRHLPSLREWMGIRTLTNAKDWTALQRGMMQRAGRVHGLRTGTFTVLLLLLIFTGMSISRTVSNRQNQAEATRIVEGLLAANTAQVSTRLTSLQKFRQWANPQLQLAFKDSPADSDAKLHAGLALVAEGQTADPAVLDYLQERVLTLAPAQLGSVLELLKPHKASLTSAYWKLATDEQQPATKRFHAACALAAFDPDSSLAQPGQQSGPRSPQEEPSGEDVRTGWNNRGFSAFVGEQLVAVSPVFVGQYQELLRSVAPQLVPPLSDIFKEPDRGELEKKRATTLLADYAANNPETLTELVLAADVVSDKSLFPVLQQHQTTAVKNLEAVLDQRLAPDWKDAPLDPKWTEPTAAIRAQIESAHGMITERFAFCQVMPLAKFLEVAESLRGSGYRPTRVRSVGGSGEWAIGRGIRVGEGEEGGSDDSVATAQSDSPLPLISAIWTRDSKRWHLDPGLSKGDLPNPDEPAIKDGLLLTDITPLPLATEATEPQFLAVWSEPDSVDEQRRVLLDIREAEFTAAQTTLAQQGLVSQCTVSVRTDKNGQRLYTGIWSNQGAPSELRAAYAGFELIEQPQWDVAIAPAAKLADPRDSLATRIEALDHQIQSLPNDQRLRQMRAELHYFCGNDQLSLEDLDLLFQAGVRTERLLRFRTFVLLRLGRAAEAIDCRKMHREQNPSSNVLLMVEVLSNAWLEKESEATRLLEDFIERERRSPASLFKAAYFAAVASGPCQVKKNGLRSLKDRAIEWLAASIDSGFSDIQAIKTNFDLANLHSDPRFTELLFRLEPPATYAALWRADVKVDSKLLAAVPVESLTEQLKPLITDGWRPFAIAIETQQGTGSGELTTTARQATENITVGATCSIVLHRPLIPDAAKESLAIKQATAATALLRLNAPERVWPLFQDQPDPRVRSYVLHRLAQYGVDPQSLFIQLQRESDTSRQRSLILALGEFARAKLLSPEQTAAVIADLAKRYADDPDSGIHGAAEWTLRQLGADTTIAEVKAAYSTGEAVGNRHWYVTKTGGINSSSGRPSPASCLCFAIITANDEFLMGSPISELERVGGPTGKNEIRHRRRIGRRFAIGTHEITVAQFRSFRSNHDFDRTKAREDDSPANRITWYDAAAYCNWLSEQEGIPRDQWCYDPDQEFAEGMSLLPDYLQRTGYRLPSEAEWDYACRAGTTTARYYGETEDLLGEFAWYGKTSGDKWMLPVRTLRPNGAGLFDTLGNAYEWCQDQILVYDTALAMMADKEHMGKLSNSSYRVLRGGSYIYGATGVRSAQRLADLPVSHPDDFGFRVGRSLPPIPATALPPAEGEKTVKIEKRPLWQAESP